MYKKGDKAANEYDAAKTALSLAGNYMYQYSYEAIADMTSCCKRVEKAGKALIKLACEVLNVSELFNNPVREMVDAAHSDEMFIRWCIKYDVEFKTENPEEVSED